MNKKCQVFTPQDYVDKILDDGGYVSILYGKRALENSCGDGRMKVPVTTNGYVAKTYNKFRKFN